MTIHNSVLELIGQTPMVKARHLDTGLCQLYLKLECMNPGGSIKDRIGVSMIEAAERAGTIKPGDTLVEGTAGNTGIGLALVGNARGYRTIIVMPETQSKEKQDAIRMTGAELRKLIKDKVEPVLAQQDGVAEVRITGGDMREIRVDVHLDKSKSAGTAPGEVAQKIGNENLNLPAGRLALGPQPPDGSAHQDQGREGAQVPGWKSASRCAKLTGFPGA